MMLDNQFPGSDLLLKIKMWSNKPGPRLAACPHYSDALRVGKCQNVRVSLPSSRCSYEYKYKPLAPASVLCAGPSVERPGRAHHGAGGDHWVTRHGAGETRGAESVLSQGPGSSHVQCTIATQADITLATQKEWAAKWLSFDVKICCPWFALCWCWLMKRVMISAVTIITIKWRITLIRGWPGNKKCSLLGKLSVTNVSLPDRVINIMTWICNYRWSLHHDDVSHIYCGWSGILIRPRLMLWMWQGERFYVDATITGKIAFNVWWQRCEVLNRGEWSGEQRCDCESGPAWTVMI